MIDIIILWMPHSGEYSLKFTFTKIFCIQNEKINCKLTENFGSFFTFMYTVYIIICHFIQLRID